MQGRFDLLSTNASHGVALVNTKRFASHMCPTPPGFAAYTVRIGKSLGPRRFERSMSSSMES